MAEGRKLDGKPEDKPKHEPTGAEIAIVGMACRFPGADTPEKFWRNLCGGVESLTLLSDEELEAAGVDPRIYGNERYVRRMPVVENEDSFDAPFFGYTPPEVRLMDPQHRLFMECAWEALERGGYDPATYDGRIGVFTGAKTNTYLLNLFADRDFFNSVDSFQVALGNDLACMATRVSFKLNLNGPSYAVHTACSTSLVAVHLACQSLLIDECSMALAGGSAVNVPQRKGYLYQPGGILSPDGSCRTFDAQAAGSNFGNGSGCVLLKRLEDALADGDHIHAVIKGSATNNDGAAKASFTAPGVEGQTEVILEALAYAGVDADSISYIEAHGTATDLGDSIEMLALNEAFRAGTQRKGFCAIGSVKTNVGHLETAAGVAGLIKTALSLEHRQLPPSLHFEEPNPKIDFEASPFFVNTELREWRGDSLPRRAGLSSFGIGSTNAHVILEEAPVVEESGASREVQLLLLSARTATALEAATGRLAEHLEGVAGPALADAAFTLKVGRRRFEHRRAVVCRDGAAAEALKSLTASTAASREDEGRDRPVAFLLPGLGDQQVNLARGLYETEPTFRELLDRCSALLERELGESIRDVLYPEGAVSTGPRSFKDLVSGSREKSPLDFTARAQPALFAVEVCLARLWMEWGVKPAALLGYSLGEYAAAHLAGVLSLEDALTLVARRAKLIGELPEGAMTAVSLSEEELRSRLPEGLSLAAVNGPGLSVAAGPTEAIAALEGELEEKGVAYRRLATTHAFHSTLLEPVAKPLTELARTFQLSPPEIPYVSNVTGTWITAEEATDPEYWARHMVQPVRFADGVEALLEDSRRVLLELGTGQSLAPFVKVHPACTDEMADRVFASLPGSFSKATDSEHAHLTLGKLWTAGVDPDWQGYYRRERRLRTPLPTYPFERQRHWVDGIAAMRAAAGLPALGQQRPQREEKEQDLSRWAYVPSWPEEPLPAGAEAAEGPWLLFLDGEGLLAAAAEQLRAAGREVVTVIPAEGAEGFERLGEGEYALAPRAAEAYGSLLQDLRVRGASPQIVLHGWGVDAQEAVILTDGADETGEEVLGRTFYSVLALEQALGRSGTAATLGVVTTGVQRILGSESLCPEKAVVLGPIKVGPQEVGGLVCRAVDVVLDGGEEGLEALATSLVAELSTPSDHRAVAYRGGKRLVESFERQALPEASPESLPLKQQGVYLVTGGLGGVGRVLSGVLARDWQARLVLTRRTPLPPREEWQAWLDEHGQDDATSRVLQDLLSFEEAGAEVLVLSADASDEAAMAGVVAQARERFGRLDGVLHAAGVGSGGLIQLKTPEEAAAVLAPKVQGTRVLEKVLADLPESEAPSFVMLFSSLQSVLGDFGQVDYCGANAFLDAYAEARAGEAGPTVVAVGWDNWQEVGIAVNTELPAHLEEWQADLLSRAITSEEGAEVFQRVLAQSRPRLVITTQSLEARIAESRYYTGQRILQEFGGGGGAAVSAPATGTLPGRTELEGRISGIWQDVLGRQRVGLEDNFFDLGGNSLLGMQLINRMNQELGTDVPPVTLFEAPTVGALVAQLAPEDAEEAAETETGTTKTVAAQVLSEGAAPLSGSRVEPIAIVGMTGRFPGAEDLEAFWSNLRQGIESTTYFSDEELLAAGVDEETLSHPTYVKARPILSDVEHFDAELFGLSPREAETMDPQHRLFLECAWEALETAACDPDRFPGRVGVFAGCAISTYLLNLHSNPELMESVGTFQTMIGNEKDSLPTRVSYKLNLRGPSVAVQTFCSTSLVAVHMACRSLQNRESDLALAGGASIHLPQMSGYHYQEGGFVSSDGRVKAFDASADGFTFGNGVAAVVLKRLDDALRDGDSIRAVIRASAVNNDGSLKVGYTATSVEGQSQVIADALEAGAIPADSIGYIEAHGTGTRLGDPVEIAALTKAFRRSSERRGDCPIGSVKTNIGHLDRAAGASGLIKAILALENEEIPPSLHLGDPNPQIDFDASPFFVNTKLRPWKKGEEPRRAGVNSLGLGGTNAHVVLEEAPPAPVSGPSRPWQLLLFSAQSGKSLDGNTERLRGYLESHEDVALADAAYTLQQGRRFLKERRFLVCRDRQDAIAGLGEEAAKRCLGGKAESSDRRPVFLFPGLGGQYAGMARGLYEGEEVFRREVDRCCDLLQEELDLDLRDLLFPAEEDGEKKASAEDDARLDFKAMLRRGQAGETKDEPLNRTAVSQPAIFVVEYALARLWQAWGVKPRALAGYSIGEYVAACLAGVLTLEDALTLVARRARLIETLDGGSMLAVSLPEEEAKKLVSDDLSLAAVNGPEQSVLAGPEAAVADLEERLAADDVACRRLQVTHAFHSHTLQPIFDQLVELVKGFDLSPPETPVVSNVTGTWMSAADATDPTYWARHMVGTVRFSDAATELLQGEAPVLLEVGPSALSSLVLQHPAAGPDATVVSCLRHSYETQADQKVLLTALGKLWLAGVGIDWKRFSAGEERRRLLLPTYSFDRRRYWVERQEGAQPGRRRRSSGETVSFSAPGWRRVGPGAPSEKAPRRWWLLGQGGGLETGIREALEDQGCTVVSVQLGEAFEDHGEGSFALPATEQAFASLVEASGGSPEGILYLWGLPEAGASGEESEEPWEASLERSFAPLLHLGGLLHRETASKPIELWAVSAEGQDVVGRESLRRRQLASFGAAAGLARNHEHFAPHFLDVELPRTNGDSLLRLGRRIAGECLSAAAPASAGSSLVALRDRHRWLPSLEPMEGASSESLGEGRAYLLLNGLGALGAPFTDFLARVSGSRLILVEGQGFPAEEEWQEWLDNDEAQGLVSQKILRIRSLREEGAEVEVLTAHLADRASLDGLLEEVSQHKEGLDGVIAVFEPEGGEPTAALAAKAANLEALTELAGALEPVFGLLVTASSFPGQPATAADAAAGLCLDAFAAAAGREGADSLSSQWTSVCWDLAPGQASGEGKGSAHDKALERLFGSELPAQVIVSREPLDEDWTRLGAFVSVEASEEEEGFAYYSRPSLQVEFVPPRTPVEETVAGIWRELLGVDRVGVYDNFLDLGGDSLLATRLISRMRDAFHLDFPIRLFFEASTVEELAEAVLRKQAEEEESDVDELLAMMDGMSEEEIEAELAKRQELAGTEA